MASRRTRIKGIANIPQRRKTATNSDEQEQPKSFSETEKTEDVKPNLTLQRGNEDGFEEKGASGIAPPPLVIDVAENPSNKTGENHVTSLDSDKTLEDETEKADKTKLDKISNVGIKPVVPARRKFIKPAVSLNAISRKTKDTDNCQKPEKNKIVILNEIITHPDQEQPITVGSFNKEESTLNVKEDSSSLKSPEIETVKLTNNFVEKDAQRLAPNTVAIINQDSEYPIPPPSPSKVNRTRIKAVPRLSQRNTSFSASESEDESRRNYRHRNDSVCSTASGLQDNNSIAECPSPQKPKEFNSVIQRKCRRTEQSRKLAEARRDFYIKFGNKKPDRQKLTMIDLIFYNPTTNLMSHESKQKKEEEEARNEEEAKNEESVDDPSKSGSDEENEIPAPQIKIGPQGEIVVDEQSLVIESKSVKRGREEIEKSKVVDGDFDTGYGVYKRAKRSKDWSKHETLKFYKALNTIGTDFTLMCELFPRRSRRELKMKFKKEERINKALIDRAIMQPCGFDFNDFKHEVEMEEKELMEMEKQKEREQHLRKEEKKRKASLALKNGQAKVAKMEDKPKKKKKKQLDIMNVLDDTSDADESEMESSVFDEEEVEEEERQNKLLRTIQKPTRSGRVPKLLERYKAPECKQAKAEPGSLIVVAGTGSNGEPVYRVCMVTAEHNRQQIGEDMNSLSKALECKQNGYIKSLFTLSSTTLPTNDDEIIEENNVTIDEEENNLTIVEEENNLTIVQDNLVVEEEHNVPIVENNVTIPAEGEDGDAGETCLLNGEESDTKG